MYNDYYKNVWGGPSVPIILLLISLEKLNKYRLASLSKFLTSDPLFVKVKEYEQVILHPINI